MCKPELVVNIAVPPHARFPLLVGRTSMATMIQRNGGCAGTDRAVIITQWPASVLPIPLRISCDTSCVSPALFTVFRPFRTIAKSHH